MWESWFNSSVNISYFLVFCLSLSQPKKKLLYPLYLLCWISTDETHLLNLQSISSSVWLAVNKPWFYFFSLILDHCFSHPSLYSGDWIFCVFTLTLLWLRINAYLPVFLKMLYSLFSLWVFSFIVLFAAFIQWIQKPGVAVLNYTQVLSHLVHLVSMRVCIHVCHCPLVVKGCNDIFVYFEMGAVLLCGHLRTVWTCKCCNAIRCTKCV